MMRNPKLILGVVGLLAFGTVAFLNLRSTMTPYVSFAEARAATGAVQVGGYPDHARARFEPETGLFRFSMSNDDGEQLQVSYAGAKPGNFDQAEKVVVVGRLDGNVLEASQILVKCPSKYEDEASQKLMDSQAKSGS